MSCRKFATGFSVVLTAVLASSVQAQDSSHQFGGARTMLIPAQIPEYAPGATSDQGIPRSVSMSRKDVVPTGPAPTPIDADQMQAPVAMPVPQQGYVRLGAPLYPSPRPNIPIWTGSTMITNQAFAPHEMLYPHTYKAIYPPFYHRVKGGWLLTPMGVRSHEKWELQGTMVEVKYRSSYPGLLSGAFWHPPATLNQHGRRWN